MKLNYFNFKPFKDRVLITNDFSNHLFITKNEFKSLLSGKIDTQSELGKELIDKRIIYDDTNLNFSSNLKFDMRYTKSYVNIATSLHIFVITTACNMNCAYCQANNGNKHTPLYMTKEMAEKSVNIALESPEKNLNFEFQGGEPLLNFEVIKHIVEYTQKNNTSHNISYNVVTNLTLLTDEILDFFCEYNFGISTSIDGPELVHDCNRPFKNGKGTFEKVIESVHRIRAKGLRVGAIQTTTRTALRYPKEIVHTYCDLGFDSIFIRPLTPLGKASVNWDHIGYTPEEFIEFYKQALDELMNLNSNVRFLKEDHASILLNRINGSLVNYMELRSPCGAGIGQLAYYANGDVFTCDEGRMLHEMGDNAFRLGNVFTSRYSDIVNNGTCKAICASSILEAIPSCCDCVYQPYCGTCPVVNYAKSNDIIEKAPRGYRCKIYSGMLDYLFDLLYENNDNVMDIINRWSN